MELNIVKGDLLLFELDRGDDAAVVGKLSMRGSENAKDKRSTG